jgi:hypothetical protein
MHLIHALVAAQAFQGSPLSADAAQDEPTRPLPEPEPYEPPVFFEPDLRGLGFGPVGPPNRAQRRGKQKAQRRSRSKP